MSGSESGDSSTWSREQDIMFENALATYSEGLLDRWQKIAADVPGKSIEEIRHHYDLLVEDVNQIESGRVPLPCYQSSSSGSLGQAGNERTSKKGGNFGQLRSDSNHNGKASRSEQERRKGIAWTEEEHKMDVVNITMQTVTATNSATRLCPCGYMSITWSTLIKRLFLQGLKKYGKGDWRSISRNYVVTRTPTQVASHAQKYYIRLNSENKDRRRSSIHDITNVNNGDMSGPLEPITGQTYDSSAGGSSGKPSKQTHSPLAASGVGMYGGTTIGQPVGGSLVSGTPVNLPQAHIAYGIRAPSGQVVPGAPVNMGPMGYPMPQTSAHR